MSTLSMTSIDLLNSYGYVVDLCRNELTKNTNIQDEETYYYAVLRMYSRVLVSCCEIFYLLKEGFPHGALSLSRQVYEGLVIIDILLTGKKDGDETMPTRFFDAAKVSDLQYNQNLAETIMKNDPSDVKTQIVLKDLKNQQNEYKKKYPNINRFCDYWWAGCDSFGKLSNKSQYRKMHMYKLTCMFTHMNAYSSLEYLDHRNGILIGETQDGLELPVWYASLCLAAIVEGINNVFPSLCPDSIIPKLNKLAQTATAFVKDINAKRQEKLKETSNKQQ